MRSTALAQIPVGVVAERRKAKSRWADFLWRPVSVFAGIASAAPWTPLDTEAEPTLFFAGEAVIEADDAGRAVGLVNLDLDDERPSGLAPDVEEAEAALVLLVLV